MIRENEIILGDKTAPILTIANRSILHCDANMTCSVTGEELAIDTLNCEFEYGKLALTYCPADADGMRSADGVDLICKGGNISVLDSISYATPVWYYNGGSYIGKFFVKTIKRQSLKTFSLEAISAIGVLDTHTYYGKLFSNTPLPDAVRDILLTDGLQDNRTPFMQELAGSLLYGPDVDALTVSGWMPACSKREALHYLFFANNLQLRKADDDSMIITWLLGGDPQEIPDNDIYQAGSVTLPDPAQRVEVTEHMYRYLSGEASVELFDNSSAAVSRDILVTFQNAPIVVSTLAVTGSLEIVSACPNAAIIRGIGTLSGVPYVHNTTVIARGAVVASNGKTVTCKNNTMICLENSDAVADKLWVYYKGRMESTQDIVLKGQLPGNRYLLHNAYGERIDGYIQNMTLDASSIVKAHCSIISNYIPVIRDNVIRNVVLLTGVGSWTVPEEVFRRSIPRIRVVLVGGGDGGYSGLRGPDGKTDGFDDPTAPRTSQPGGANGRSGNGGRIYQFTIEGDALKRTYSYSCGAGGKGGAACDSLTESNPGSPGKPSLFDGVSSDLGAVSPKGIKNYFNSETYGWYYNHSFEAKAVDGYWASDEDSPYWGDYQDYPKHPCGGFSSAGNMMAGAMYIWDWQNGGYIRFEGVRPIEEMFYKVFFNSAGHEYCRVSNGTQGGSAADPNGVAKGSPGGRWSVDGTRFTSGAGGNGADATRRPGNPMVYGASNYGWGGLGGFGGGAGGHCGCVDVTDHNLAQAYPGAVGKGGRGGPGGSGAPGCILVYY